jgi:DNA-binding CsgD family transcriptional regulator
MERHVAAIEDACTRSGDTLELFAALSDRLRKVVPFDGGAWFGVDPSAILPTAPVRIENIEAGHCESYWEREATVEDTLLYRDLARAASPAGSLYQATDDRPARSARYREFLAPQSYGDEVRAAFKTGGSTWGVVDIFREQGRTPFTSADLSFLAAVGPVIASALRSFATATMSAPPASVDAPGTALFDGPACGLLSLDEQAERWFTELAGESWATIPLAMTAVYAVVARAGAVAEGRERGPAAVRLRAASGRWLSVHASALRNPLGGSAPIAVTIEPAKSAQIAPIIVEAYCLTAREQQITQAVARGLSNQEIAAELFLSAHTVRDHLKAVFAKVGVGSRGELVAKLFADHYGPALHEPGGNLHVEV